MNDLFRQYYARLRRGGIVKSLLWGVAVGFLAAFVAALVTWMTYFDGFFLTIGVFVAVAAATALICYFRFFRPTAKDVARKVDSLGLEERMITMLELEKSDDYIALRQREDAQRSLQKLGMNKFKFGISLALVLVLSIGGVFALSMTTVTGLSDLGVIPSGAQLIDEAAGRNPRNYVDVVYSAMEGGYIYGESEQNLRKGEQSMLRPMRTSPLRRGFCPWTRTAPPRRLTATRRPTSRPRTATVRVAPPRPPTPGSRPPIMTTSTTGSRSTRTCSAITTRKPWNSLQRTGNSPTICACSLRHISVR